MLFVQDYYMEKKRVYFIITLRYALLKNKIKSKRAKVAIKINNRTLQAAWLGQPKELHYIGEGSNVLPTIHVKDLSTVILHVISHPPEDQYVLGVDDSNHTQKEIIEVFKQLNNEYKKGLNINSIVGNK
jgi:hypothetical protein